MLPRGAIVTAWSGMITPQVKTGRAGALTPDLPALTPEAPEAPVNHAPLADECQPHPRFRANDLSVELADLFSAALDAKRETGTPGDCWLWNGPVGAEGYGIVRARIDGRPKPLLAHRVAYVLGSRQPLVNRATVDHVCGVRRCLNPAHLDSVSLPENVRRRHEAVGANLSERNVPTRLVMEQHHTKTTEDRYRRVCPFCRVAYAPSYLKVHIIKQHPQDF